MITISCVKTSIALSCEKYTNRGGSYELYKEVIESITDPFSWCGSMKLGCERSGLNSNPMISFYAPMPEGEILWDIIEEIESKICHRLGIPFRHSSAWNP